MSLTDKNERVDISGLNDIYRDLYDLLGFDNMQKIHEQYKGLQISFPTKLYNKDYIREVIRTEYNGGNTQELAKRFGYSERWVRKIIEEL